MGRKLKLPFHFMKSTETTSSWPWPNCGSTKTLSFRAGNHNVFKTMNSAYIETSSSIELVDIPDSSPFSNSCESASFSTATEASGEESIENVIQGLRSERLFFEPGETSSILEQVKNDGGFPFKESLVMAVDSRDPFVDFRRSMEEMVEAHGLKDWECLEELLTCYLRVNGKSNHGYIVGAFVDLLLIHQEKMVMFEADWDRKTPFQTLLPFQEIMCLSPALNKIQSSGEKHEKSTSILILVQGKRANGGRRCFNATFEEEYKYFMAIQIRSLQHLFSSMIVRYGLLNDKHTS